MKNEPLVSYVAGRIRGGKNKSEVKEELLAVGWSEEEADTAFSEALVAEGIPIPARTVKGVLSKKSSTADIMIGFFSFILLGISVSALGTLLFEVIDRYFPDPAVNRAVGSIVSSESVHYSIAALFVSAPLYFFAIRLWFRRFREDDARVESRLTKWVTYIVLLAASVTAVGDLIAVLFAFLQGEITIRFFLKAFVVFGIAGMVFGFYFLERKKIQYGADISRAVFQGFGWGFLGLVLISVVLGFFAVGSPEMARRQNFDERRAAHLSELARCIDSYADRFSRLPNTLSELEKSTEFGYCSGLRDPETDDSYEYRLIKNFSVPYEEASEAEFELCAVFSLESKGSGSLANEPMLYSEYGDDFGKWAKHSAGRACDREIITLSRSKD